MPTYEYACTSCGERTEARQSFDDPPLETCLACGGKLRKLYSPVGIVFKGTGFYSTDGKKAAKGESGSSDKSDGSDKKDNKSKSDPAPDKSSGSSKSDTKTTASESST